MKKTRLDLALLGRGLASTRAKAQALILAGKVTVDGSPSMRPGEKVGEEAEIHLLEPEHPYVSRGGLKLEWALREFGLSVSGKRALDIGQSTGGFTDCLLRGGAREVWGVEVGHSQLAPVLRRDPRVVCMEKQDFRSLEPKDSGGAFDFFVADLSFISLTLVLPRIPLFLREGAQGVVLVKPQFEVGPEGTGSGGIVRDPETRERGLRKVLNACKESGFVVGGVIPSPISGGDGNEEALVQLEWHSSPNRF